MTCSNRVVMNITTVNTISIPHSLKPSMLRIFLLLLIPVAVQAEIRQYDTIVKADSSYVHYSEGYIVAPGFVDLSKLTFTTIEDPSDQAYDPNVRDPGDETAGDSEKDDDHTVPGDVDANPNKDGGGRLLVVDSTLDVVLFHEPAECSNTHKGCDWTELGVGVSDPSGGVRWCCSNEAVDSGFCTDGQEFGRLLVNKTRFKGEHRSVNIPKSGGVSATIHYAKLEEPEISGKYIFVLASCNDEGRDVRVFGEYTWKSVHGYLPGDIFGEMYFFAFLATTYLVLSLWYGITMKVYEDALIPIQKWVLGTIVLGLLETVFRVSDYLAWNAHGTRFWFLMYIGVIVGVIKRGLSRCLIVMMSLGWGVVRDRLDQMKAIVALGIIYVATATARDIMTLVAVTEDEILSANAETQLFDAVTIITFVVAAVDVTFYMWILDALNGTMEYLENMNQRVKLMRYLHLRTILLFSILFAVLWSVFSLVNAYSETAILEEQNVWTVSALMELNYLGVLVGVAYLWRPNSHAKDLAYVMELPALGGDDNDLEMTATVPSALDDDDDDDDEVEFRDEPDNGLK